MMDTDNHILSTRLCAVLNTIGASEDIRQLFWDTSIASEIAYTTITLINGSTRKRSLYHFGSSCEGTTTLGLQSDRDFLICEEDMPVIDSIIDVTERLCYLMVKDCNTKPGYVQLQTVVNGIPQCNSFGPAINGKEEFDEYGRTCLIQPKEKSKMKWKEYSITTTTNGPADSFFDGMVDIDSVDALRCRNVPNSANSWIHRTRQYDWPSKKQIQRMKSFGCFLVGVAHPYSLTKSIDWRISFSLQERELMWGLNPTQHKCYILLKIIKNDLIEPRTGKSISSYHCKTSLFYTIETSVSSIWTPENLILCTRMCLECLLDWSKNGNCPNYFIPEENMFDRLEKQTLENVNTELTYILSNGIGFLFRLECDVIGTRLREKPFGIPHNERDTHKTIECRQNMTIVESNYDVRKMCLRIIPAESNESIFRLKGLMTHLQETNRVTEHSTREVRMALSYIIPHIHLQIAQSLASVEIRRRGTTTYDLLPLDILLNIIESSPSSRISARLSLATCYLQFGMLEACEQLLLAAEISFKQKVGSVCSCYYAQSYRDISHVITLIIDCHNITTKEFVEHCTTGCLVFLQSQANIVHPALQYEMYRSVYTAVGSRNIDFWLDWIVVVSKVYLLFLQYIFCIKTNAPGNRRRIVETFRHVIEEDNSISHRETACNLLGWMLIQEHRAIEALQCFCRSWRIRPFHNAAKWHIVLLLNDILR